MKPFVTLATLLLAFASAQANEVYKTTDSQGRPVYTDKPASLPAERLDVKSATTDTVEVQRRYDEQMKQMPIIAETAPIEAGRMPPGRPPGRPS